MIDKPTLQKVKIEESQQEVIDFLSDPDNYNGSDQRRSRVNVISTHCAFVFLYGNTAYKIKRAVIYSYLDSSELRTRKALCERELSLNQPVLPEIYLGVVSITKDSEGQLAINGVGDIVEWALHMHRFDESLVLDNIAKTNSLTPQICKKLGENLADYHNNIPSESVSDGYDRIAEVVHELIHELSQLVSVFNTEELSTFRQAGIKSLEECRFSLNQRAEDGFIKRCHGDLHLRNIIMYNGSPVPFDALEFDERMATTDVLYDLAFLIMDLGHRRLHDLENVVLNEYLLHSDQANLRALGILPLFLFCRAGIKAMTSAQTGTHSAGNVDGVTGEAREYMAQALSYLTEREAHLIVIGGLSGTGKSTVATALPALMSSSPGALVLRSDAERKVALNIAETQEIPAEYYTPETSRLNYQLLFHKARQALDAGYPVIIDAVFNAYDQRKEAEEIAIARKMHFTGFWLSAPADVLGRRIAQRTGDASDATVEVLRKQMAKPIGKMNWHAIDASGSVEKTVSQIVRYIAKPPL